MSEEFTKFLTVYNETKKIVVLTEFEDLYDRIQSVYKNVPGFPKKFKVLYEDKDMEEYVDLDSPIQLMDRNCISKVKMRKIKKTLMKRLHQGMIYCRTILLKAVSATFGPRTMFKQQSLSFHVVSKTFITQNYLVLISSNILCFSCLCPFCLALFACFQARANTILKKEDIGEKVSYDVC